MDPCRVLICLALCAVWHVGPTLGQSQTDMNVLARLENLEQQVSGQQHQLEVQNKLILDLQTRVTNQESAIIKQQATINEHQTTIVNQQKTIAEQHTEISQQQSSLSEQHRRLTRLEGILIVHQPNKGNWTGMKTDVEEDRADQSEDTSDAVHHTRRVGSGHSNHQERDVTFTKRPLCAVWHVGPTLGQSQTDMNVLARLENLEQQVSGQQHQLEVQNKLILDLQTRVTNQESAIIKQQATINEHQTTIVNQQKTIAEQHTEISQQQSSLSEQHRRLTRLEGILIVHQPNKGNWTGMKTDVEEDRADQSEDTSDVVHHTRRVGSAHSNHQERDVTNTKRRSQQRLVRADDGPVAFHAVNTNAENSHIRNGQHIMFPTVLLNQRSGYHNLHGTFIAPTAGLYIFSTSVMIFYNHNIFTAVSIVKNGAVLARAIADGEAGNHDQGSITVVTQLAIGDEVWVSQYGPPDVSYYGDSYTSFMGCLIWFQQI